MLAVLLYSTSTVAACTPGTDTGFSGGWEFLRSGVPTPLCPPMHKAVSCIVMLSSSSHNVIGIIMKLLVSVYLLFALCVHVGAGFNWGRRRRRRDVAVVNAGINNIRSNSSIPNKVTAEELLKELQEAEKRLKEMGLIKVRNMSTCMCSAMASVYFSKH